MMIGMMLSGLFTIVVGFLTLGLAGNAVWRAVMAPHGTPRQAGCGSCGYELTSLEGGRCSECGADLIKAGISTRRNLVRVGGSLAAGLMGWTVLIGTVALVAFYLVFSIGMVNAGMAGTSSYGASFDFGPEETFDTERGVFVSKADFQINVSVDVVGDWGGPADSGTIVSTLTHADETITITWPDASDPSWVMQDKAGSQIGSGPGFTLNNATDAFKAVGINLAADPANIVYVTQFQTLLNAAYQDPFSFEYELDEFEDDETHIQQTGGGMTPSMNAVNAVFAGDSTTNIISGVILGASVLVWVGGCVFIVIRRNRLITSARV